MDSKNDRRKFENILREPLTRYRLMLNAKLREAQDPQEPKPFTFDDLQKILRSIKTQDPDFAKEIVNVAAAVQTGLPVTAPRFDTPETQLAWGAALAFLSTTPDQMKSWQTPPAEGEGLENTDLWKQITQTPVAYRELLSHAHHVRETLRDKDTKYSWGAPGSGFGFDRQKNHIVVDLMQSMIVGFEHARADVYREIGRSLLSVTYPKRMQEIYRQMQPLMKKSRAAQAKKGPQLKPEEYKELRMLSAEWQLRHMMYSAAEENVANRFVANTGIQALQDYSVSLNNTAVTHRAIGLTRPPAGDDADDLRRYMNLCNAVQLGFFQNNSLFEDTDKGWMKVGVIPALVRKTSTLAARPKDQKSDNDGISHPDFQHLRELCGGPKGLENLQPKPHERLYGWDSLQGRVQRADAERIKIIEDIWRLYGEELIQNVLKNVNEQVDQQLKEAKEKQQEKQDGEGEEQDQDQDGDQDQDQEGQGKPQKGKKGKPQKGKKGDRGKPQGEVQDMDDLDDEDGDDQDGQEKEGKKDKKDKKDKSQKGKGEKEDGEPEDGDKGEPQKGEKEGKLGADDENKVPVEGAGEMAAPETPTEMPSDEVDPSADGQDADGDDADGEGNENDSENDGEDGDEGKTTEELEEELEEMEASEQDADGQDQDGEGEGQGKKAGKKPGKSKPGKPGKQAGHGEGKKLGDLAKQDWTKYNERVAELSAQISRVRKIFKQVQERQVQRKRVHSPTLDILPENGEVKDRFNAEAHQNLVIKKTLGGLEEGDLKRFHKDEPKFIPTEIDIVIMIDGSGSMGSGSPSPLDSALQATAILYEAAAGKDMKMNVYVGMWGERAPPIIIKPGDDRVSVGRAMQAARSGLHSGTDFAPAVKRVAEVIGEARGKSGTLSGFTHVLILSDGDIFDEKLALQNLNTIFECSDKVTFDTAIITSKSTYKSKMQTMAEGHKGRKPFQDIGVTVGNDPEEVPMAIVGLLLEKIRKCGSFIAIPNSQKRRMMNKAKNKMDKKP
jgi:hypothetical protein